MLTVRMVGRRDRDRGHTVPEAIGERHYWDAVGRLWSDLVAVTYDESVAAAGSAYADWPAGPFEARSRRRVVPRYFSDRRELLEIGARPWRRTGRLDQFGAPDASRSRASGDP